jgi:DNA polymerase-3 subunit epsilon
MQWQGCDVLGFDTETTGVSVSNDRIVTCALVRRHRDGRVETRTWLIDPQVEIPQAAWRVHGITTEHAREHGAQPAEALPEIASMLAQAGADGVPVLAFNAAFDLRLLEAELARHSLETLESRLGRAFSPVIDPLVIDREVDRYRRGKRTLADLVEYYGVRVDNNLHDAQEDVMASIAVFDAITRAHPQLDEMDADALHSWQEAAHRRWAVRFNEFLKSKGRNPTVELDWP